MKKRNMQYRYFTIHIAFVFFFLHLQAQDTVNIAEVKVVSYPGMQTLFRSPAAVAVIDSVQLQTQAFHSLVTSMNTVAGVRMEERSPGSYRLSIRGSLLRSPFGVRNIKVYIDEYPFTDAGGNTYLNTISMDAISRIEILKGPDGSIFGANSGGVLTILPGNNENFSVGVATGTYGLFKQNAGFSQYSSKNNFSFSESYYKNDGYRQNSKMHRLYLQVMNNWQYSEKSILKLFTFYSDLFYQTPGGLTNQQYQNDPSQARQPTTALPGATEQKAAVHNKMLFGGITHSSQLSSAIKHTVSIFASSVDFKNPFITNYETRKEKTFGARTYFVVANNASKKANMEYNIGAEWQQTNAGINNYKNIQGEKGLLLASGKIKTVQYFIFNRVKAVINKKMSAEAAISFNHYQYDFADSFHLTNSFKPQWMPRFAVSYFVNNQILLRSSISRGYSPPTTAEIRPSDNMIYTNLQPETGINTEIGGRYFSVNKKFWVDISLFNYILHDAIVRQQTAQATEFFVNAGGTRQRGIELQAYYQLISSWQNKQVRKFQLNTSLAWSDFRFANYKIDTTNYSGNFLTGVPKFTTVNSLLMELKNGFYFFIQHNHTSAIPLNDANTVRAASFELVQLKAGYTFRPQKIIIQLTIGADNILNVSYSLGNDLNAAGGRYYNAAPLRNYFAAIKIFKQKGW